MLRQTLCKTLCKTLRLMHRPILPMLVFTLLFGGKAFTQATLDPESLLAWKLPTDGPVYASPVLSEGILYIGSMDSTFYAIDAETGEEKWQFPAGNTIQSGAALYDHLVFFESGNCLYALNTRGKLVWKNQLCEGEVNNQLDPWDYHHSSPYIHEGVVYIGTEQGILWGFQAETGDQVLRCQTLSEQVIRTTPVVAGQLVIYGDWEGVLYANDISTGALAWKYDTRVEGTYPWANSILTSLVVGDDAVYFAGKSNRLYSLDVRTGKKNWHYSSPTDQWLIGGPVLNEGVIYLGSSDQHLLHAIDASSGGLMWTADLDGRIWGRAAMDEGRLYVGSNSLFIIDTSSGEILEQYVFPKVHEDRQYGEYTDRSANFHSSPLLFEDLIILGSDDGNIYALKLPTG